MASLRPAGPGWLVEQVNCVLKLNFSAQLAPYIIFDHVIIIILTITVIIIVNSQLNPHHGYHLQEEVVRRTEAITRCIQELLISAKDEKVRPKLYLFEIFLISPKDEKVKPKLFLFKIFLISFSLTRSSRAPSA